MTSLDLSIIAAYLVLIALLSVWLSRRAKQSTESYFLSGRNLPWWIAGISMAATAFSADTPLYVTNITRQGGIGANWEWWAYGAGGMFSAFVLAPLWRRCGVVTDLELSELRYDGQGAKWLRATRAGAFSLVVNPVSMALVIKGMETILQDAFLIPADILLPLCLVVTAAYSLTAGFWGVVVTDVLQFVLAFAGALVLAFVAVDHVGGLSALQDKLSALPVERQPFNLWPQDGELWYTGLGALAIMLGVQWWAFLNADGGGKIIQRQLASKNENHAMWGTLLFNVTHYALRPWPWILVAAASLTMFPDGGQGENAYVRVAMATLPEGLRGFMLATFLAAFMSTIDTQLNWGSSYFIHDLYKRFLKPNESDAHYVRLSRLFGALLMAGAYLLASHADGVTEIFRFLLAMGAGLGPVLVLRWFWWRLNAYSELAAMLTSMTAATVGKQLGLALIPNLLWTLGISLVVTGVVTFLTPPVGRERLRTFVELARPWGFWPDKPANPYSLARALGLFVLFSVWLLALTLSFGVLLTGFTVQGSILVGLAFVLTLACLWVLRRGGKVFG